MMNSPDATDATDTTDTTTTHSTKYLRHNTVLGMLDAVVFLNLD